MYQDHGGKSTKWSSKDGFNCECKLHVIGKRGHYFIKTCNKPYPLKIRNSDNPVVKSSSENDDVVDYGL